ncbi:F0F1 ATP synthase subunit A [Glycomyces tenuis]|uniref:F0F1 ATP synthase subunit A n=1 Tax=Glycomyces tenuis TaxID=58116 RepID=UPI0004249C45|nr:F0F1 ATP synthase subunit A [Glycomyces tenuis]
MTDSAKVLAEELHFPPGTDSFNFRDWFPGLSDTALANVFTTITFAVWLTVAILIVFFLWAYRKPQIVPTKRQWLAESAYGFVRDTVSVEVLGKKEGVRFAPYLTCLFLFVVLMNFWAIVPFVQISPNSHIAFPATLGILSWVIYNYVGIRKHGFLGYLKMTCVPPGAPVFIYPLLIPIEFLQNLILRPVTLALRLFANMFAGHLILLVFILGGFTLLQSDNLFIQGVSVVSWAFGIAMTFFELIVILLQAYVFTLLTTLYIQGSLADEH